MRKGTTRELNIPSVILDFDSLHVKNVTYPLKIFTNRKQPFLELRRKG